MQSRIKIRFSYVFLKIIERPTGMEDMVLRICNILPLYCNESLYFFGSHIISRELNRPLVLLQHMNLFSKVKNYFRSPEHFLNDEIWTSLSSRFHFCRLVPIVCPGLLHYKQSWGHKVCLNVQSTFPCIVLMQLLHK